MILSCIDCGTEFEAKRKDTQRCPICKAKRRSLQVMLSRKRKHPEIEIGVGSGRSSKNQKGLNNHNTTTGVAIYRTLIEKDRCAWCGSTKNLLVHHKDEDRTNPDPSNLICLCKKCHQNLHTVRDEKTGRYLAK